MLTLYEDVNINYNEDFLNLTIRLTNLCTFKCEYCHYYDNLNYTINHKRSCIDKIITFVKTLKVKHLNIYIHGGEPTLHPLFLRLVNSLSELKNINKIEIDTNLSNYILLRVKNKHLFSIGCSYHHTRIDINTFLYRYQLLQQEFEDIKIRFMYYAKYTDELDKIYEKIKIFKHKVRNIGHRVIHDEHKHYRILYKNKEMILSRHEIDKKGLNTFRLMKCNSSKHSLIIDVNGDVFYCHSYFLKNTHKLFNIFNDHNYMYIRPDYTLCLLGTCKCGYEFKKVSREF